MDRFWVLPLHYPPLTARSIASRGSPAPGTIRGSELFGVGFVRVSPGPESLPPSLFFLPLSPPLHMG